MPPTNLKKLVPGIAPTPLLLIAAPNSPHGEELNRGYYRAASDPKTLWEILSPNTPAGSPRDRRNTSGASSDSST